MSKCVLLLILSIFAFNACSKKEAPEESQTGYLVLNINNSATLKTGTEISDFTLLVTGEGGAEALKSIIAELPEQIDLPVGNYTIEVYSDEFSEPKFDEPFYYGKTTASIEQGITKEVSLVCSQANAGVRVVWSDEFINLYTTYQAQMVNDEGYLNYSSNETRTGYFLPGTVSVIIMADGQNIDGGSFTLAAQDMVIANMHPKNAKSGALFFDITLNITVNERNLEIIADPENIINSESSPYNIAQGIARQGENEVWISGYIVGSKPSSGYDFVNGTWQRTNIVIADNISETNDLNCIFVELPAGGTRNNLNLVDNPELLHQKLVIKGNLNRYQSRAGLTGVRANNYSFQ